MSAVLCFGETLWDSTPTGRFLGGAPLNVAYHLQRLGTPALLVSAVGIDEAGDAALASIAASGLDTAAVRRHPSAPTGMAVVALDARGEPTFRILPDVAWDEIVEPPENAAATLAGFDQTPAPSAILYGTLADRKSVV